MSIYAVKTYLKELEDLKHYGGTSKETAIRFAFHKLLDSYAATKDLRLVAEISLKTKAGKTVTPDGTLKDQLRLDWGYWESKDESDDINEEIQKKFSKGYPNDNILFEDSVTAVLIQHGTEVLRVPMEDEEALDKLLTKFINYQRKEIIDFREAINKFREDIPKVTEAVREIIQKQFEPGPPGTNHVGQDPSFASALHAFHELCKQSINPDISEDDLKEMMVQHIITADIFNTIFDEAHFHQENNIARELNKVIETFFTGATRRQTLGGIKHYYDTINAAAAGIADHHEKQKFLKVVYENFYKAYNPKAADRLGIVYTPNEIVQFMIKSTDYLLHKHFGKVLADKNVEILDPATGTGTFICDIIDYLPKKNIEYKYKNEIHANELAILPYYIANLNIEYTYKQKTGQYAEFENLCFVDTLDNTGFHWVGKQGDLFGMSAENAVRIKKQNDKKISVIIGNPPYNANQQNENDNNKNREYPAIDKRIKDTYIKNSTAQKTKLYDMYSRFYRWAMDRLTENGVIAFITNRSFIDSRTFDGFRKSIQQDFDHAYIIDTKSDVRSNPKIAGSTHNVFGIQAGVAVLFLVKSSTGRIKHNCKIEYIAMEDEWRKEEKLHWFTEHPFEKIEFENVVPDKNNNWLNITDNDWDSLIPIADKDVKVGKSEQAIFRLHSLGVVTNRDEWCYDFNEKSLDKKVNFFCDFYLNEKERWNVSNKTMPINDFVNRTIKWTEELESHLKKGSSLNFIPERIRRANYRPFTKKYTYVDKIISHRLYQNQDIWGIEKQTGNKVIILTIHPQVDLSFFCSDILVDQGFGSRASTVLPLYRFDKNGDRTDNITDWGLIQFTNHYKKTVAKQDVFHYVYAILHYPAYRTKYHLNLKREFPRIPFYDDFWQWAKWGEQLMDLHINYEKVTPYKLHRSNILNDLAAGAKFDSLNKAKLKADKVAGTITIDGCTELNGIPPEAWLYKLGNRSALEWVLDQYKEKKPGDPTIAEKFNTYKFADYKEHVIDLLQRVCTVSVQTIKILNEMPD
jgi:predicted helicase